MKGQLIARRDRPASEISINSYMSLLFRVFAGAFIFVSLPSCGRESEKVTRTEKCIGKISNSRAARIARPDDVPSFYIKINENRVSVHPEQNSEMTLGEFIIFGKKLEPSPNYIIQADKKISCDRIGDIGLTIVNSGLCVYSYCSFIDE